MINTEIYQFNLNIKRMEKSISRILILQKLVKNEFLCEDSSIENIIKDIKISENNIDIYRNYISSLYSIFEQFVESVILEYLTIINNKVRDTSGLPPKLLNRHYEKSMDLYREVEWNHKVKDATHKLNIIENVYKTMKNEEIYNLNTYAYILHSNNLRIETIREMLNNIGIEDAFHKIINSSKFKKALIRLNYFVDEYDYSRTDDLTKFSPLADLVERRNIISHSYQISEYLSYSELKRMKVYLKVLCETINNILNEELIRVLWLNNYADKIGLVNSVVSNNIVIISDVKCEFSSSDFILFETDDKHLRISKVKRIENNGQEISTCKPHLVNGVGIELFLNIRNYPELYVIRKKDVLLT